MNKANQELALFGGLFGLAVLVGASLKRKQQGIGARGRKPGRRVRCGATARAPYPCHVPE